MRALLLFLFCFLVDDVFCQKEYGSFSIQPGATDLLRGNETDSLLRSLDGFLSLLRKPTEPNPYIDPDLRSYNPAGFNSFSAFLHSSSSDSSYKSVNVLAVLPIVKHQQYLIKLTCMSVKALDKVRHDITYSLIVTKKQQDYFFSTALEYNTQHWNRKQVGTISYVFPNRLDMDSAKKMDLFNKEMARKFSTPVLNILYYKCYNPEQLFKIMGFDFIPNMYYSATGGIAESWKNALFAGNNSEWYPHEVLHFYTGKLYPGRNRIIDEGYATYLGGSGQQSLNELAKLVKNYIDDVPAHSFLDDFINFKRIEGDIPLTYVVSALICKDIEEKLGFVKIKELFGAGQSPEEYFTHLEKVRGIAKAQFLNYAKSLINQEILKKKRRN